MIGSTFLVVCPSAPFHSPSFHPVAHGSPGWSRHWRTRRPSYRSCTSSIISPSRARVRGLHPRLFCPSSPGQRGARVPAPPLTECVPEKKLAWPINTSPAVCDVLTYVLTLISAELQEGCVSPASQGVLCRGPPSN